MHTSNGETLLPVSQRLWRKYDGSSLKSGDKLLILNLRGLYGRAITLSVGQKCEGNEGSGCSELHGERECGGLMVKECKDGKALEGCGQAAFEI